MNTRPNDPTAIELARERIHTLDSLLVARLVAIRDDPVVELGLTSIRPVGLACSIMPLRFRAGSITAVRMLVEAGIEAQSRATFGDNRVVILAGYRALVATMLRSPNGDLFTLGGADGLRSTFVPVADAGAMARVLIAAERQLAELGIAPPSGRSLN